MKTTNETFQLHPQLAKDCIQLGTFELSLLLLMNNSQYPWFILVPMLPDIREIHHLSQTQQYRLMDESSALASFIESHYQADKLNIAALGNMVPQLHVHHIARYKTDSCWPAPIWGKTGDAPYTDADIEKIHNMVQQQLEITALPLV